MSASPSPLGYGLYFIDVLACLLFCLTLALVGARFGRELTVELDLPRLEADAASGPDLTARSVALRSRNGETEIFLGDERVTLAELEARLQQAPPPSLLVRSEESPLARVIGIAHGAGVADIQLAYESERASGVSR